MDTEDRTVLGSFYHGMTIIGHELDDSNCCFLSFLRLQHQHPVVVLSY